MDVNDRLPQTGNHGYLHKLHMQGKLIEYKRYIGKHGEDMPEILNSQWSFGKSAKGG